MYNQLREDQAEVKEESHRIVPNFTPAIEKIIVLSRYAIISYLRVVGSGEWIRGVEWVGGDRVGV